MFIFSHLKQAVGLQTSKIYFTFKCLQFASLHHFNSLRWQRIFPFDEGQGHLAIRTGSWIFSWIVSKVIKKKTMSLKKKTLYEKTLSKIIEYTKKLQHLLYLKVSHSLFFKIPLRYFTVTHMHIPLYVCRFSHIHTYTQKPYKCIHLHI